MTPLLQSPGSILEEKIHFDTLRASVINGVSASVIAFASGQGLPLSTTYVAFAAVPGTGLSDRVFARGHAEKKLGRTIWVISCWLIALVIAIVATGSVALHVHNFSICGLGGCILINLGVWRFLKSRANRLEKKHHLNLSDSIDD